MNQRTPVTPSRFVKLAFLAALSILGAIRAADGADPVVAWNRMARDAVRFSNTPPPEAARWMAILHLAIHDAVQGTGDGDYLPYRAHTNPPPASAVSVGAAIAAAGNTVLRQAWPDFTEAFDAELQAQGLTVPDGSAKTAGLAWGRQVAFALLRERAFDGSQYGVDYQPVPGPGRWRPTPVLFASALLPQWPGVKPFALNAGDQFRPAGPPALTMSAWASDFDEVRRLGRRDSVERTREQTEIAWFWADGAGTETPPGHWNEVAVQFAESKGLAPGESARLFALLNVALADAGIAAWDAKYAYDFWRPITAIREAGSDGNPDTAAEATWSPLISTPPFPEYVSGHSTFSAAAAAVLAGYQGDDRFGFVLKSQGLFGVERRFERFSDAAAEAGMSRIFGGIHFMSANRDGQELGERIGEWVTANLLPRQGRPMLSLFRRDGRLDLRWPAGLLLEACDGGVGQPWRVVDATGLRMAEGDGPSRFFRLRVAAAH